MEKKGILSKIFISLNFIANSLLMSNDDHEPLFLGCNTSTFTSIVDLVEVGLRKICK